ncbi:hypothetical protein MANY_33740 [Mycolicibacterium anyangense]|uniref:Uncharacterized protein n=1 Tax=Mycolicibacterium anyangense TaxID=1431246 RepID=A0A6N4WCU3_9MYCO|nr:hypothetical protein [Mycolicibacterium anyangense]BBZ78037.1 hypothetical protein MANY_33740 [Mycolicibacterium anyangense]
MSWDLPERSWRFAFEDDPPADLPHAWAAAARAVTHDLGCRRYGRPISLNGMCWNFKASDDCIALGFDGPVGAYHRCLGYLLETSAPQALVWLAGDVQYTLAGSEWVQWPISGQRMLDPRLVDDHAVWVEPSMNAPAAAIGELCTAAEEPSPIVRQSGTG